MRGRILIISPRTEAGALVADSGKRFLFHLADWKDGQAPQRGMAVEFRLDENRRPRQVHPAPSAS